MYLSLSLLASCGLDLRLEFVADMIIFVLQIQVSEIAEIKITGRRFFFLLGLLLLFGQIGELLDERSFRIYAQLGAPSQGSVVGIILARRSPLDFKQIIAISLSYYDKSPSSL